MVHRITQYTFVFTIFLFLFVMNVAWPADNPFVGTWKLNADKSRGTSGQVPSGRTTKIESEGKNLVLTMEGGGITTAQKQHLVFDGHEHPTGATPLVRLSGATHVLFKQVSRTEIEALYKKDGQVVATQKRTISQDGRILTSTMDGVSADGEKFQERFVYDKQ